MKNQDKIKFADDIIALFNNTKSEQIKNEPVHIGHLNKAIGFNGFKRNEIGTPVFKDGDKYIIYIETLDSKQVQRIPYNMETLKSAIEFL